MEQSIKVGDHLIDNLHYADIRIFSTTLRFSRKKCEYQLINYRTKNIIKIARINSVAMFHYLAVHCISVV